MKRWYVAYTKQGHEKKVTEVLGRKKIEHYCPINTIPELWSEQGTFIRARLFKSYVFARLCEHELDKIYHVEGVINLVYRLGQPAVINDAEIDSIKQFLRQYNNVRVEKISIDLKQGTPLTVLSSQQNNGKLHTETTKQSKLVLPELGYILFGEERMIVDEISEQPGAGREEYSPRHYPSGIFHQAGQMMRLLRVKLFQQ